ncbi:MAG: hypothetical protein WCO81_10205 [Cyanobacteriota bacterium ELA615]|jgi:hypothetical protein
MNLVVRNYVSSVLVVVASSVIGSNLFYQPVRFASQDRVNEFNHYLTAGIVIKAQQLEH